VNWELLEKQDLLYAKLPIFRKRIEKANEIIDRALEMIKNPYLACSFGKDSSVMLHLVLQKKGDIPIVFINQGECAEWPDTYKLRDKLIKEWNLNYIELHPPSLFSLYEKYGISWIDGGQEIENKICEDLIYKPARELIKKWNFDGVFMGLRKEESRSRFMSGATRGPIYKVRNIYKSEKGIFHCTPLLNWKGQDIWSYITSKNIPFNEIYKKTKFATRDRIRNAPWSGTTSANLGRLKFLEYYYPDLFNKFVKKFPRIRGYI